MKTIQEITQWDTEYSVPNHVYFVNDSRDKMYAYINKEGRIDEVKTPYRFHTRGRKFKEVPNTWGFKPRDQVEVETTGETYQVPGSKGAIYTVTNDRGAWTCTCSGFKFRGQCRHVESI